MTTERNSQVKTLVGVVALLALGVGGGYWWAHSTMMSGQPAGPTSSMPMANPLRLKSICDKSLKRLPGFRALILRTSLTRLHFSLLGIMDQTLGKKIWRRRWKK